MTVTFNWRQTAPQRVNREEVFGQSKMGIVPVMTTEGIFHSDGKHSLIVLLPF